MAATAVRPDSNDSTQFSMNSRPSDEPCANLLHSRRINGTAAYNRLKVLTLANRAKKRLQLAMCKINLGLGDKTLSEVDKIVSRIHDYTTRSSMEHVIHAAGLGSKDSFTRVIASRTPSPTCSFSESDHFQCEPVTNGRRARQWTDHSIITIHEAAPEALKYVVTLQGPTPTHSPRRLILESQERIRTVSDSHLKCMPSFFVSPVTSPMRSLDSTDMLPLCKSSSPLQNSDVPCIAPRITKTEDERNARILMSLRGEDA